MKNVLAVILVVLAVGLPFIYGCGEATKTGGEKVYAKEFKDGTEKYFSMQTTCPVCGGTPIKKKFHAELKGKRVYFDKEECSNKFKENPSKYRDTLDRGVEEYLGGGG